MTPELPTRPAEDEPPPFLGSWKNVYWMVAIYLVCVIAALAALTRAYA